MVERNRGGTIQPALSVLHLLRLFGAIPITLLF